MQYWLPNASEMEYNRSGLQQQQQKKTKGESKTKQKKQQNTKEQTKPVIYKSFHVLKVVFRFAFQVEILTKRKITLY